MATRLKVISLFTGAGGLDFGFEEAGYDTAVAVECDATCVATLQQNRRWRVIGRDIATISAEEILRTAKLKIGQADALIGGPPCQPFSKSGFWATGDARRLNDPRATTLERYLDVLEQTRPKTFLLENVEGLGFKGKDEGLRQIKRRLEAINERHGTSYLPSVAVLNTADFGVPQFRRRLFIVGARDGTLFTFPHPTHGPQSKSNASYCSAWAALRDVAIDPADDLKLRGKWADLLPTIPEGENYLWHTERGGGEALFGWRRRYWSFLLKLAKSVPSWTLQAQPGPATGPFHWDNRRLSVDEMARLQCFPKSIKFAGKYADAQKQIGNAVPSLMAEILAREMAVQLLGRSAYRGKPHLSIAKPSGSPPSPENVVRVPKKYLALRGQHEAHPGTGKGYRAVELGSAKPAKPARKLRHLEQAG